MDSWPFVSVREIVKDLGIGRQRVHQIIKEHDLGSRKFGNMLLVNIEDYNYYLKLRRRRDLATAAGRKKNTLIRNAEVDQTCKVCGSYAVSWEGTVACKSGHVYKEGE